MIAPRAITVATYNIHRCIGTDRRHDPDRIAAVIRELGADIVGLQEVDARYHIENGCDQAEYIARAAEMMNISGPALIHHRGTYGNALLTRWPVRAVRRYEIGIAGREPRVVLDTEVQVGERTIRVVVTHFGLREPERNQQAEMLSRILEQHKTDRTVLLGDFNEWVPIGRALQRLHVALGRSRGVRSFPSPLPLFALDRVWVRPARALQGLCAHRSRLARVASDHLPVRAAVEIGD